MSKEVKYDSKEVALALALKLSRYAQSLERKPTPTDAQKRHLLRIRTAKAIRVNRGAR